MNDPLERILNSAKNESRLTDDERERMRALLSEYAKMRPIRAAIETRARSTVSYFMRPAFSFVAVLLIVTLGGSGIAYAAEESLPGDLLYPLKVDVTEPARSAITAPGAARAAWHMRLAERRLDEAAALAKRGRLEAAVEARLAERFEQASGKAAVELAEAGVDTSIAGVGFASRLDTYDTVLARVLDRSDRPLRGALLRAAQSWEGDQRLSLAATTTDGAHAAELELEADRTVKYTKLAVGARARALSATSSEQAEKRLEEASHYIKAGREKLKQSDRRGALREFRAAIRVAAEADVLTHASAELQVTVEDETEGGGATSSPSELPTGEDPGTATSTSGAQSGGTAASSTTSLPNVSLPL